MKRLIFAVPLLFLSYASQTFVAPPWIEGSEPSPASLYKIAQATKPSGCAFKLSARAVVLKGQELVAGRLAPNLTVVIRNDDPGCRNPPAAIALRGVHWDNYRPDPRPWLRPILGVTVEQKDATIEHTSQGAIAHTLDAPPITHLMFETGLILPGEELAVPLPITPQGDGKHGLVVSLAVIADATYVTGKVLLPGETHEFVTTYSPITEERLRARRGSGGLAIVASTSKPDNPQPPIQQVVLPLQLPLGPDPFFERGRLSIQEAARRAGLDPLPEKHWAFYREPLKSWFFVRDDGSAVTLRWGVGLAQAFFMDLFPRPLPNMDVTAPDEFCRLKDKRTALLLHPDTFGDLVKVNRPTGGINDPGVTRVTPQELWAVLDRARERGIELRLVRFAPRGLGAQHLLSAGVTIDEAGRWIDPKVEPIKPPSPGDR